MIMENESSCVFIIVRDFIHHMNVLVSTSVDSVDEQNKLLSGGVRCQEAIGLNLNWVYT